MLKTTGVKLELLTDTDMLLMFKDGIRGGVATVSNRYGKANNKYMGGEYDPEQPSKFIGYWDANNLYGWAMSKPLSTGQFKWMTPKERNNWKKYQCILEVDLEYPEDLHEKFNDYPPAPERVIVESSKVEKLIPNLRNKERRGSL